MLLYVTICLQTKTHNDIAHRTTQRHKTPNKRNNDVNNKQHNEIYIDVSEKERHITTQRHRHTQTPNFLYVVCCVVSFLCVSFFRGYAVSSMLFVSLISLCCLCHFVHSLQTYETPQQPFFVVLSFFIVSLGGCVVVGCVFVVCLCHYMFANYKERRE